MTAKPGQAAGWWVCDGPPPACGRKITGPFATRELALTVRNYVERSEGRTDLWVDDEPAAAQQPQPAPGAARVFQGQMPAADGITTSVSGEQPAPELAALDAIEKVASSQRAELPS
jgi:hypothetical protein